MPRVKKASGKTRASFPPVSVVNHDSHEGCATIVSEPLSPPVPDDKTNCNSQQCYSGTVARVHAFRSHHSTNCWLPHATIYSSRALTGVTIRAPRETAPEPSPPLQKTDDHINHRNTGDREKRRKGNPLPPSPLELKTHVTRLDPTRLHSRFRPPRPRRRRRLPPRQRPGRCRACPSSSPHPPRRGPGEKGYIAPSTNGGTQRGGQRTEGAFTNMVAAGTLARPGVRDEKQQQGITAKRMSRHDVTTGC